MLMEKALDKNFWQSVKTDPKFKDFLASIKEEYKQKQYDGEIPVITFSSRMRFYSDGDRSEYEAQSFRRKSLLSTTAILALVYEDEKYIREIEELIWAICDEYTWVSCAHTDGTYQKDTSVIDLHAGEIAFTLAEISYVLGDRLDERIRERISIEIKKRILDNYDNNTYWWESTFNNWAAVCAGNVGGTIIYAYPELLPKYLPRILKTLDSFLGGFPDDGTCLEGVAYWGYGFGNFVWFADLLYQHTNGEINLFDNPKVARIAGYVRRSIMKGNTTATFSDCGDALEVSLKAGKTLVGFLAKKFPDEPVDIPAFFKKPFSKNDYWKHYLRDFCYYEDDTADFEIKPQDYFLDGAGQVMINREKYSLAAKAGTNAESHNHNDVGNFIISTDKGQVIWDVGSAEYTRQYFDDSLRYTFFTTSSRGHNLPIINGMYQKPGWQQRGKLNFDGENIDIEMQDAYRIDGLSRLNRSLKCLDDKVVLTDNFDIKYKSFVERFITVVKPEICKNEVRFSGIAIRFDSSKCTPKLTIETYNAKRHEIQTEGLVRSVYCVDFELKEGLDSISFEFII